MGDFDKDLINEFVAEAKEHLGTIEDDFMELEKQKDSPNKELVNKVFRAIHTIKGSAGFFGLKNINDLAHVMETVLSLVRTSELKITSNMVDILLQGVDRLKVLIDDAAESNNQNVADIVSKVTSLLNNPKEVKSENLIKKIVIDAETCGCKPEFEINTQNISAIPENQRYIYMLCYELEELEKQGGIGAKGLVSQLEKTGTILAVTSSALSGLSSEEATKKPLFYNVLYATVLDPDFILEAVEIDKDKMVSFSKNEFIEKYLTKAGDSKKSEVNLVSADKQNGQTLKAGNVNSGSGSDIQPKDGLAEQSKFSSETVRIRLDVLDKLMMLAGELVLVRNQHIINTSKNDSVSRAIAQRLDIVTTDIQETIMFTRMQPLGNLFGKFTRIVRDLGKTLNKKIELQITGNEVEIDRTILEGLADPLTHIVRNCCDHGLELAQERTTKGKPEVGKIHINAYHEGGRINIEVSDDGKGIDTNFIKKKVVAKGIMSMDDIGVLSEKQLLELIFIPGFSTVENVSSVSGRGVGMDVVKTGIERLGGIVEIASKINEGTIIKIRLPLTLAIIPSLIISEKNCKFAIPQINLEEIVCLYDEDIYNKIECAGNNELFRLRDSLLPIVHLSEVLQHKNSFTAKDRAEATENSRNKRKKARDEYLNSKGAGSEKGVSLKFAVLKVGNNRLGLVVDDVLSTEEIVVKPVHEAVKLISIYSGVTVLGDGSIAMILDTIGIANHAGLSEDDFAVKSSAAKAVDSEDSKFDNGELLIFKSGNKEFFASNLSKIKRIEKIDPEKIELVGNSEYITIEDKSTEVVRLESKMNVSPLTSSQNLFLILPKKSSKNSGLLVSQLIDVGKYRYKLESDTHKDFGIKGSAILNSHMTLFIDIEELFGS